MPAPDARQTIARLARAMQAARPLVDVLASPVKLAGLDAIWLARPDEAHAAVEKLLNAVAVRVGAPEFAIAPSLAELSVFEQIVNARIAEEAWPSILHAARSTPAIDLDRIVREAVAASFEGSIPCQLVRSFDGVMLRAYATGSSRGRAVVLASACGMPAKLSDGWMRQLADDHFVMTWETRGLFDASGEREFDRMATDVDTQARDLFAVMDHFGVASSHVMGLCGGAVIALAGAAARPARVGSLSLWYGDYQFGEPGYATTHQNNLRALLSMAAQDRASAASLHAIFCESIRTAGRPDRAVQTLYPYAAPELLHRYARLNGSIMSADCDARTAGAVQPALVVTSQTDVTAHPAGSRRIAGRLARAALHVEAAGDHISLFDAEPRIVELAARFIDEHHAGPARHEATIDVGASI